VISLIKSKIIAQAQATHHVGLLNSNQ